MKASGVKVNSSSASGAIIDSSLTYYLLSKGEGFVFKNKLLTEKDLEEALASST